jgi:hypothetical protein
MVTSVAARMNIKPKQAAVCAACHSVTFLDIQRQHEWHYAETIGFQRIGGGARIFLSRFGYRDNRRAAAYVFIRVKLASACDFKIVCPLGKARQRLQQ